MRLKLSIVILLCFGLYDVKSDKDERVLSVELNPGCEEQNYANCASLTLVHVQADSDNNTLHYLWDFTGTPSLFLAKTARKTSLGIDWDKFMHGKPNTVSFSSQPDFVFSSVVSRILLFDDASDKGDVNDDSVKDVTAINPITFTWRRENLTQLQDQHVMLFINATVSGNETINWNGTFAMKVT